jgi:acetyl-CoA carboxylase, biotin carboxylase subunit
VKRVLVANRGEIAVRVIRACQVLGLETVAVYSEADRTSLHVRLADRALCIGPPRPMESYLNINALIAAACGSGCDAIHPGYGFLAENAGLPEMCERVGLIFVGPPAPVIRLMGDKLAARRFVAKLGVPVMTGTDEPVSCAAEARAIVEAVGYPLLLTAAAGGGGRGMRVVRAPDDLREAYDNAQAEAHAAFGDARLYVEQYLERARHVEVQILADGHGGCLHLGERDCSSQRRHQKLIEEAPCPALPEALRAEMTEAAIAIAREAGYRSAGTVEFLVDVEHGRYYFLEMNTRIQVEHPVTEMVTGVDLVAAQLRIAARERLSLTQGDVRPRGHAIECRINAEAPEAGFRPSPGPITTWRPPRGDGLRVDTHCYEGYVVPPFYDSLLAKVIAAAPDRDTARERLLRALDAFVVQGVATTISFHRRVLDAPRFADGDIHTGWIEETFAMCGRRPENSKMSP